MNDSQVWVALVTGVASGIGAATARLLAEKGPVVVADINDRAGEDVAAQIRAAGLQAQFVHLDVTSEDSWKAAVSAAVAAFGGLDILVNNAGFGDWDPIEETSLQTYLDTVGVTQIGTFLGLKHCAEHLKKSGFRGRGQHELDFRRKRRVRGSDAGLPLGQGSRADADQDRCAGLSKGRRTRQLGPHGDHRHTTDRPDRGP